MMRVSGLAAVLAVFAVNSVYAGGEPSPGRHTLFLANFASLEKADTAAGSGAIVSKGVELCKGRWGGGVRITGDGCVQFAAKDNLDPEQGTFMFWFRPDWSTETRTGSHSLLSWGWGDGAPAAPELGHGYCVLSDGWWESGGGADRTYLVFENQLYAHTSQSLEYRVGEWVHFAFTWQWTSNRPTAVLYRNGDKIGAAFGRPHKSIPHLKTPIHLGSDRGTPMAGKRCAEGVFDAVHILDVALSEEAVRQAFRDQEPNWPEIEARKHAWLTDVLKKPYVPERNQAGKILESRALLDEGNGWASPDGAVAVLDKLTEAGFNVYIPCVWHGRGTTWPSKLAPFDARTAKVVGENPDFDPLANLVRLAHARGVEVHPWFCVCYRDPKWPHFGEFWEEGTHPKAFEAQNPAFRERIVNMMLEVVHTYDIDGLNLDYIRTVGLSKSKTAQEGYRKRYGRDLLADLEQKAPNGWPNPRVVAWQNAAIADIVRRTAEGARAVRADIVISIDGHPALPGRRPGIQGRDGFGWAQEGWVDVIYCMDYGRRLAWETAEVVRDALDRPAAYVTIVGNYERTKDRKVVPREGDLVANLIAFCQRKSRGNGVALYLLSQLDEAQTTALRKGPFSENGIPHWLRASGKAPRQSNRTE